MGMAASQVRLLALTDRLHDVELKAQQILAQKLALGTQKDALYNDYCDKLEATNYMVAFRDDANYGAKRYVDANYQNLCTYIPERMRQYALVDNRTGKLLVSQDEKETYEDYENDKYAYAMAMMGLDEGFGTADLGGDGSGTTVGLNTGKDMANATYLKGIDTSSTDPLSDTEIDLLKSVHGEDDNFAKALRDYKNGLEQGDGETKEEYNERIGNLAKNIRSTYGTKVNELLTTENDNSVLKGDGNDVLMTEAEMRAFAGASEDIQKYLRGFIDAIYDEDCTDPQAAFENFREALYDKIGSQIFNEMDIIQNGSQGDDAEDFDKQEFDFYVNRWTAIKNAGGCEVVDPRYETGETGREWLENMVKAGLITIQECVDGEWKDTSVATSTNGNCLMEESDEAGLKKAEAEYEHELDLIDRKESRMDQELAKLETERKAITTEMESINTVKDDNIDRTFGIFG